MKKNKLPRPITPSKAREIVVQERIAAEIAPKDAIQMRLQRIFDAGLRNEESLWFARGEARRKLRQNMQLYPEEFRAKRHSFSMMMNKALPSKIEHTVETKQSPVTSDQLQKAGLSIEQIKELAFGTAQLPAPEES